MKNENETFGITVTEKGRNCPAVSVCASAASAAPSAQLLSSVFGDNYYVLVLAYEHVWLRYDAGVCTEKRSWADFYESSRDMRNEERAVETLLQNAR